MALESLTLMRLDEWMPLLAHSTAVPAPAAQLVSPPPIPAPEVTCRSAGLVPKTGWYEALLPPDHPDYAYYSQVPGRFVRMHEGTRMLTLGVVPLVDEALVVWTWRRET